MYQLSSDQSQQQYQPKPDQAIIQITWNKKRIGQLAFKRDQTVKDIKIWLCKKYGIPSNIRIYKQETSLPSQITIQQLLKKIGNVNGKRISLAMSFTQETPFIHAYSTVNCKPFIADNCQIKNVNQQQNICVFPINQELKRIGLATLNKKSQIFRQKKTLSDQEQQVLTVTLENGLSIDCSTNLNFYCLWTKQGKQMRGWKRFLIKQGCKQLSKNDKIYAIDSRAQGPIIKPIQIVQIKCQILKIQADDIKEGKFDNNYFRIEISGKGYKENQKEIQKERYPIIVNNLCVQFSKGLNVPNFPFKMLSQFNQEKKYEQNSETSARQSSYSNSRNQQTYRQNMNSDQKKVQISSQVIPKYTCWFAKQTKISVQTKEAGKQISNLFVNLYNKEKKYEDCIRWMNKYETFDADEIILHKSKKKEFNRYIQIELENGLTISCNAQARFLCLGNVFKSYENPDKDLCFGPQQMLRFGQEDTMQITKITVKKDKIRLYHIEADGHHQQTKERTKANITLFVEGLCCLNDFTPEGLSISQMVENKGNPPTYIKLKLSSQTIAEIQESKDYGKKTLFDLCTSEKNEIFDFFVETGGFYIEQARKVSDFLKTLAKLKIKDSQFQIIAAKQVWSKEASKELNQAKKSYEVEVLFQLLSGNTQVLSQQQMMQTIKPCVRSLPVYEERDSRGYPTYANKMYARIPGLSVQSFQPHQNFFWAKPVIGSIFMPNLQKLAMQEEVVFEIEVHSALRYKDNLILMPYTYLHVWGVDRKDGVKYVKLHELATPCFKKNIVLWADATPANNCREIESIQKSGSVQVIKTRSTEATVAWLAIFFDLFRERVQDQLQIRLISNMTRTEWVGPEQAETKNFYAGVQLVQKIRRFNQKCSSSFQSKKFSSQKQLASLSQIPIRMYCGDLKRAQQNFKDKNVKFKSKHIITDDPSPLATFVKFKPLDD